MMKIAAALVPFSLTRLEDQTLRVLLTIETTELLLKRLQGQQPLCCSGLLSLYSWGTTAGIVALITPPGPLQLRKGL